MEKIGCLIGIYLCVLIGSVWSQATVSVNEDMMLKPGGNVTLNCIGSNGDISFYIRNRVNWEVKFPNGTVTRLTDGFYTHRNSKSLFEGSNAIYKFSYGKGNAGQHFNITVKDLKFTDDGEYTCTLYDEGNQVISQQSMKLTVVSPVRQLRLELHKPDGTVLSRDSFTEGDTAFKLSPGQYKVTCRSRGSNPKPQLMLEYDGMMVNTAQMDELVVKPEGPTYTSVVEVADLNLKSMTAEQVVLCESNIGGDFYKKKRAGIKMVVNIDKPHFMCSNLTTAPDEKYRKLECVLMTKEGASAPICQNVFWKFGDKGDIHQVGHNEKYTDQKKRLYGTVESNCQEVENGLKVSLTIFIINTNHMSTTFYIGYGVGDDAEQTPVLIDLKETSAASVLTPLSLLISMLAAIFSRHVARSL